MCMLCTAKDLVDDITAEIVEKIGASEDEIGRIVTGVIVSIELTSILMYGAPDEIYVLVHSGYNIDEFRKGLVDGFCAAHAEQTGDFTQNGVGVC